MLLSRGAVQQRPRTHPPSPSPTCQVYGYSTIPVLPLAQPGARRGSTYNCTCKSSSSGGVRRRTLAGPVRPSWPSRSRQRAAPGSWQEWVAPAYLYDSWARDSPGDCSLSSGLCAPRALSQSRQEGATRLAGPMHRA
jgi:hypothetical protein